MLHTALIHNKQNSERKVDPYFPLYAHNDSAVDEKLENDMSMRFTADQSLRIVHDHTRRTDKLTVTCVLRSGSYALDFARSPRAHEHLDKDLDNPNEKRKAKRE